MTVQTVAPESISRAVSDPPGRPRRRSRRGAGGVAPWLFLAPGYLLFLALIIYPTLRAFQISFYDWGIIAGSVSRFLGVDNYVRAFHDQHFWTSLGNSAVYMVLTVPLQIVLGLAVALLLKARSPVQPLFRVLFYLPVVTSWVVVSLLFKFLFADAGLVNWTLGSVLHVSDGGTSWLSERWTGMVAISALGVWKGIGWSMMIFLAAVQGVPKSLEEAATVDGAGRWSRFRAVTLPAIWPAMAFVTVMLVIGGFNVFTSVVLMTGGAPGGQTDVLLTYMYQQAFRQPGLRLRLGDRRAAHGGSVPALAVPDARLPPIGECVMTVLAPGRRSSAPAVVRYVLLTVGAVVMVTPFVYMVSTSFKAQAYVLTLPPQFVPHPATVANYTEAWGSQDFSRYFLNSVIVAVASTALSLLLSSMMAYAFARFRFRGRETLFRILLLGLMVPTIMLIIPQFVLAKYLGLLDSLTGLVVFYVAGSLSLNTFLLRGFFESIPAELDQAMQVDGAGAWTRYSRLVLPLAKPALATATIFTFLASWDEFPWALTTINTPEKRTLPVAIQLFQGQNATQWGLVFAASLIAIVPVVLVFIAFQRYFVQGLTSGAVKG
ncbi:ABC transporter permease [Nakamurella endophytica]|nr:ABC transporter permease subunit [Nakamurella endophytica]